MKLGTWTSRQDLRSAFSPFKGDGAAYSPADVEDDFSYLQDDDDGDKSKYTTYYP